MEKDRELTKEQWKAIAEKLASYLYSGCSYQDNCVCTVNYLAQVFR